MGQSRPLFVYFCSFLITISIIQIEKSIDGVLGIQTWGCSMVGAVETTEQWRPPTIFWFQPLCLHLFDFLFFHLSLCPLFNRSLMSFNLCRLSPSVCLYLIFYISPISLLFNCLHVCSSLCLPLFDWLSVWPDLANFWLFGEILNVFGHFWTVL